MEHHTKNAFGPKPISFNIAGLAELSMLAPTPLPYESDWITDWTAEYESAVFQTIVDETHALLVKLMKDYSETYEGYVYDEDAEDEERWIDHTVTLKDFDITVGSQNNGYYGVIYSIDIEMVDGWDCLEDEEVYALSANETVHEFAGVLEDAINKHIDDFWEICNEAIMEHIDMCEMAEEETA